MTKDELLAKQKYDFQDLVEIMSILRSKDGCPWDREQTHDSIRKNLIEEAYEVVEAIDERDNAHICEELGDLLLQVVFHSKISQQENAFDISDVTTGICKKLIYRHPHIFSGEKRETSEQVLNAWEELKRAEKGRKTLGDNLDSVCKSLPALQKCQKLIKKTYQFGSDDIDDILCSNKLTGNEKLISQELACVCAKAHQLGVNAEEVLDKLCNEYVDKVKKQEADG